MTENKEHKKLGTNRIEQNKLEDNKHEPNKSEQMNHEHNKPDEDLFWADNIAKEVIERCENDPVLKAIVKKQGYLVYDEKTPSGIIHIGSGRGWVIHDAIAKALRKQGVKAKFVLSSDDIDPYDKPNKDLPSTFDKYLGMPFRNIPSPVEGYKSFADYFFRQSTDKFEEFGIEAELASTGDDYNNGVFNKAIKILLDNAEKVNNIYERFYGKAPDKLPFNPICEKCGKIATTRAISWDTTREMLKYRCEEDLVEWAKGCGHSGEISPYNGNGKFPWKVEWPAKWFSKGVVCEYAGKDHFTKGGSRSIGIAISDEILDYMPPYPSSRREIGSAYEFFTIEGSKMSTSKGKGISFADSTDYLPAPIIRYLLIATRPRAVIDFNPIGTNDVILLFERFDKTERIYFGKEELTNEKEAMQHKRTYELAYIGKIPKTMPIQIPFLHASLVVQSAPDEEKAIKILQNQGMIPKKASKKELESVKLRLKFAKKWIERFAPEQFKFQIQESVDDSKLSEKEKNAFRMLADSLKNNEYDEKSLHLEFGRISEQIGLDIKEFYKAAYLVLLNKERGPKLASLIITVGSQKIIELLEKI